jgi:hypothetical protein
MKHVSVFANEIDEIVGSPKLIMVLRMMLVKSL